MSKPVPPHLYNLLARELERGERVVWYACPPALGRALDSIPGLLFGILTIGFALQWTWGATDGFTTPAYGLGLIEYVGGGMLALLGVSGLFSPLLAARWLAPRTLYAITDRRAIHIEIPVRRAIVR